MTPDVDTAIRDALDARAATTTTSADAWARIGRRATRRDRRRTAIVRVAAASVVAAVALGGTVAVLAAQGGDSATVATSEPADGGAATESRAADEAIPESGAPGPDLRIERGQDGSVTFLRDDEVLGVVASVDGASATVVGSTGSTVFGITAAGATQVRLVVEGVDFSRPTMTFTDLVLPERVLFVAEGVSAGLVTVESLDSAGNVISTSSRVVGG